jgi:two-component system cell cycle response regulator DivK
MKGDEERIMEAGCDGYIAKPFDYKELLARVAEIIGSAPEVTTP